MKKLIISILVVLLCLGGIWMGRPAYKRWVARRSVAQAQAALTARDYRMASLCARKALAANPANREATRIMAQFAELAGSPAAIKWWQRLVELEPERLEHRLSLVRVALAHHNPGLARKTLEDVHGAGRNTAAFHETSAMVAMAAGQLHEAEAQFAAALKLDPDNPVLRLNQAVLQGQSTNQQVAQAAAKTLAELAGNPAVRRNALRQLSLLAQHQNDLERARVYSEQLQADPAANFDDRLLHLDVLAKSQPSASTQFLATLRLDAAQHPEWILSLVQWQIGQNQTRAALEWLNQLPEEQKSTQPVELAMADCYVKLEDWDKLSPLLEDKNWEALEFLRLAVLARAETEQGHALAGRSHWKLAVRAATDSLQTLQTLLRLATLWKWEPERENLLWTMVQSYPSERWALRELEKIYYGSGNTRGLQKVYAEDASFNLQDVDAKNNLATVLMLLNTQLRQAQELAQQVYASAPHQPAYVTTYAYAQHLQGNTQAGLEALEKLKPEILRQPNVAAYYGVMLAAAGQTNKAREYLTLARTGRLLPEELALVDKAQ